MHINVHITYDILRRTAYLHPAFTSTYSALPYAIRPLLPDLHCYRQYAGFCDHNGFERGFNLTKEMTEFYDEFLETKPENRTNLKTRVLLLDIPEDIVTYLGEARILREMRGTNHLKLAR
jgi:hypothetical protein